MRIESTDTKIVRVFECAWLANPLQILLPEDVMWVSSAFFGSAPSVVAARLRDLCGEGKLARHNGGYRLHPDHDPVHRVTPAGLLQVALSYGWKEVEQAKADGLHVLNTPLPGSEYVQLIFPVEVQDVGMWAETARLNLDKLSAVHGRPVWALVRETLGD
jgi:hypothetical protein